MGRQSTPKQSSNGNKAIKSSTKTVYASKLIDDIFTRTADEVHRNIKKNPKTIKKWSAKMKRSIQRKISIC